MDGMGRVPGPRPKPLSLRKLLPARSAKALPLLWSVDDVRPLPPDSRALVVQLGRLKRPQCCAAEPELCQTLASWLAEADGRAPDHVYALQCLAWAHALPRLAAARIRPTVVGVAVAPALHVWRDPARRGRPMPMGATVAGRRITGHLALRVARAGHLSRTGRAGTNGSRQAWTSCWTAKACPTPITCACCPAAGVLDPRQPVSLVHKDIRLKSAARTQYAYVLEHALRWSRPDRTQVLSSHSAEDGQISTDLVRTALAQAHDPECTALARTVLPRKAGVAHRGGGDLPDKPSGNSSWSGLAILRADWSSASPRLAVSYAKPRLESELINDAAVIWSGPCQPTVEVDGVVLQPRSNWEELCWFDDDDVDYLELEIELEGQWRLQRQICLARDDRFLYVADAVVGQSPAAICYRCRWPLCGDVRFAAAEETCEGLLVGRKKLGLVLPLALPEWRTDRRLGQLASSPGGLELQQAANSQNLYAPLFVDLDPRRLRKAVTWRQLTVAENLEIVPREAAIGFRAQVGTEQWLIYRSLTEPATRTVLGQHIGTEFLIGRFDDEGQADPLLEVEPA